MFNDFYFISLLLIPTVNLLKKVTIVHIIIIVKRTDINEIYACIRIIISINYKLFKLLNYSNIACTRILNGH